MASQIIQSYLSDMTIPVEKRRYALDQINGGTPEKDIENAINIKYKGKYTTPIQTTPKAPIPTSAPFDMGTFYQDKEVQTALKQSAKTPDTQLPQGGMGRQPEGVVTPEPTEQQLIMGGSTKPLTPEAKQGMEAAGYSKEGEELSKNVPSPIDIAAGIGKTIAAPVITAKNLLEAAPDVAKLAMLATKVSQGTATSEESQEVATLIQRANKNLEEGMSSVETVGRIGAGTNPLLQGAMSASKTLATDLAKGDDILPAVGESLWEGGKDAALTVVFNKLFAAPKVKGVGTTKAKLAGLTTADINAATKGAVTPERGMEIIEAAAKATEEHGRTAALENVAEKSFLPTIRALEAQEATIGKRIGEVTESMRGKGVPQLDVLPVRKVFEQDLRALGVKFKGGKPVLTGSKIEGLGADNLIKEAWDFASPKKGETGTAFKNMFDVYNKIGNLREKIFKGKANMELGQADRALANLRNGLKDRIVNMRGEYGDLAKGYAQLDDFLTEISKATSEGVKSKEFLRKLFGQASSMSRDQLSRMEELAKQYGIKEGTNIFNESQLAIAAESAAKYEPASSLQGVVGKGIPSKSGVVNQVIEMGKEKAFGTPLDNLKRLLNMPQEQITPSRIESLLSNADPELKRGLMKYLNVKSAEQTALDRAPVSSAPRVKSSIPKELKPLTEKTSFNAGEIPTTKIYNTPEEFIKDVGSRPYISGIPPRWFYKKGGLDGIPTEVPPQAAKMLDKAKFEFNPQVKKVTRTSSNLYHTTPAENLDSIMKKGLTTGNKPRYEGVSGKGVLSFSANEKGAAYYGGNSDVMLRTKSSYRPKDLDIDLLAGGEGIYTTKSNIPPEMLEIKVKGKWQDLKTYQK